MRARGRIAEIHYNRLPDRLSIFRQPIVHEEADFTITYLESADLPKPVTVDGRLVLEPGAPVIWFTYPGRWYDIGRFHLSDGTFTGWYANILTPVEMIGDVWSTTDLALDVWCGREGDVRILDRDEFDHAVRSGWIDEETAVQAMKTAETLADLAMAGKWPPEETLVWTLKRVRVR